MAVAFPGSLPRPMRAGYGFQATQPHAESANDRGLSRRRRIATGTSTKSTLAWIFTESELQTFAQWWRDDVAYGTADFDIQLLNGYDDVSQIVKATGPYTASRLNGAWQVSVPIECTAPPIASQAVMQDAIDNYSSLILVNDFHYLVHVIIPENI